jgi:hypothetical protein
LHDGSEIAWGPRACCRGGRGGDGTYISHRIWWMLWEDHSRISRSRSSSATTGAGRIRGPLGDLWLKSRRQGKIGSASLLALWTTFVGCRSSFSRWLAGWLACLQDRSAVESVRSTKCPLGHWPGAVNWRRVRQDQDDLTARVSRRLHVARKCSAVQCSDESDDWEWDHGSWNGNATEQGAGQAGSFEALKP